MTAPIVTAATSKLESRFVVNALLPTLVFLPLVSATALHAIFGMPNVLRWYVGLSPTLIVLVSLGMIASAWLIAALLASQWDRLVGFYEGYPLESLYGFLVRHRHTSALGDIIYVPGKMSHQRRQERLKKNVVSGVTPESELRLAYPDDPEHILPTRLGNIIRSAELYPLDRYGIDFTILWTRLAMLLPEHLLRDLERSTMQYQLPLVISAWGSLIAAMSLLLAVTGYFWHFLGVFTTSVLVAFAGYYWSLRAAENFGIAVRSVFDLHRDSLHAKWPRIMTAHLEREDFDRLQRFIVTGTFEKTPSRESHFPQSKAPRQENDSAAARTPRFKPALLPTARLSTLAVLASVAALAVSWGYVNVKKIDVAVASSTADPFGPFIVEPQKVSLYRSGGLRAREKLENATRVHALRRIAAGDIVTRRYYIELNITPDTVFQVAQKKATNELALEAGDTVSVVFHGKADYESDPQCLALREAGVNRLVVGRVLTSSKSTGILVVGADSGASAAVRCFGLNHVDLVRVR